MQKKWKTKEIRRNNLQKCKINIEEEEKINKFLLEETQNNDKTKNTYQKNIYDDNYQLNIKY